MFDQKKLTVSHAPFVHIGSRIDVKNYQIMLAAAPAVLAGLYLYGMPALAVVSLAISSAMLWELVMNRISKRAVTIHDGHAAMVPPQPHQHAHRG